MAFLGGLFKGKAKSFLGVDLGAGGIKVVELGLKDGRAKLLTYGYTDKYFDEKSGDYLGNPKIPAILADICKKAKTVSREATTALPLHKVVTSVIAVAAVPDAMLRPAVEVEAAKLIDYPVADAVIDFKVLKEEEKTVAPSLPPDGLGVAGSPRLGFGEAGGRAKLKVKKILVTVTRKDLIKKYLDIFKNAGLILKTLETESFALSRSLVGKDKSSICVIDFGAYRTSVVVVDSSVPVLSRSAGVGGINLTEVISKIMGVDVNAAEEAKKDLSKSGDLGETLPQPVKDLLAPVVSEARYLFNLFGKEENKTIEKIILTGGSSFFPNLADYFTRELGIRTFLGDPWARILYHESLKDILDNLGPRFSVAIGLAMREIE